MRKNWTVPTDTTAPISSMTPAPQGALDLYPLPLPTHDLPIDVLAASAESLSPPPRKAFVTPFLTSPSPAVSTGTSLECLN